jgi:3-dehydroquinate dehydratase-1
MVLKIKICGSIPINTCNIKDNLLMLRNGIEKSPDFIELRFDYLNDIKNLTTSHLKSLLDNSDIPLIFTIRKPSEGGHLVIGETERNFIIKQFILVKPDYIDIEIKNDLEFLRKTIPILLENNIGLIFSYHDFEKTPSIRDMKSLVEKAKSILIRDLDIPFGFFKNIIFKFIFMAKSFEDNYFALKLNKEISNKDQKIISFCMGEIGFLSRLLCVKTGAFMTYASLVKKTAPGQISIENMRKIYDVVF